MCLFVKPLLVSSLCFFVAGCGTEVWHPVSPPPRNGIGVLLTSATDVDNEEHAKVNRALVLLDAVLHDESFFRAIAAGPELGHVRTVAQACNEGENVGKTSLGEGSTYAWNSIPDASGETIKVSNEQVVALLRRAHEPGGQQDQVLEFGIRRNLRPLAPWCGWPWYGEMGHREPPNVVMTQDCKMKRMSAPVLAAHWLHEYMHMLGFDHAFNGDQLRPFSVPYFVGDLAEALATRIEEGRANTDGPLRSDRGDAPTEHE